jgi:hypothetical protein
VITALTSIPPFPNLSLELENTISSTSLLLASLLEGSKALSSLLITARIDPGVQLTFDPDGTRVFQKKPSFQALDVAGDSRKVSSDLKGEYTRFIAYMVMKRKLTTCQGKNEAAGRINGVSLPKTVREEFAACENCVD